MRKRTIDGTDITSIEALHKHLKEQLKLSSDYGESLEALREELAVIAHPMEIVLVHEQKMRKNIGDYTDQLIDLLTDLTYYNKNIYFTRNCKSELED